MSHESVFDLQILLLCLVSFIDGMDQALLPASFMAIKKDLNLTDQNLGILSLFQALGLAICCPIWGFISDIYQRKGTIIAGTIGWSVIALALVIVSDFYKMCGLRFLNGCFLASLNPIGQSLISDTVPEAHRGKVFGATQFSVFSGIVIASLLGTTISQQVFFGVSGWRLSIAFMAAVSLLIGLALNVGLQEPFRDRSTRGIGSAFTSQITDLKTFFQIPTFRVLVIQGVFGNVTWSGLNFATVFFQELGLKDSEAALLVALLYIGAAIGAFAGGYIGDYLSRLSPDHGRPFTAQISVFAGIPFVCLIFRYYPRSPNFFVLYSLMMFCLGLSSSWVLPGVNRPILSEIVPTSKRASIFSWLVALEGTSAAVLGAPVVGFLSTHLHGPDNATKVGKAIFWDTSIPWTICFLLYTFLHLTYGYDRMVTSALE